MNNLELAIAYYEGNDNVGIKEDLDMCEYHLKKAQEEDPSNPEIFYYYGLLYSENEDFEDIDKAIFNYKKSFDLGYRESALNLAFLYETNFENNIQNKTRALKWYLRYGDAKFDKTIRKLTDEIVQYYLNNENLLEDGITNLKKLAHLIENQIYKKFIFKKIDLLINKYISGLNLNVHGLEEIECVLEKLEIYKNNHLVKNKIIELTKEKNILLIKEANTIEKALKLLEKTDEYQFENSEYNSLLEFVIFSYLYGTHGATLSFDTAMEYKKLCKGEVYFVDSYLIEKTYECIEKGMLEKAKSYCCYIDSPKIRYKYENIIFEKEQQEEFKRMCDLASSGDEESTLSVAKMYETGTGTNIDRKIAFDLYVEVFKKYQNISAFEGAMRCYKTAYNNSDSVMKNLFLLADEKNIVLPQTLQNQRYLFFIPIMKYGDEYIELDDLSRYYSNEFSNVSDEWIQKLGDALREKGITKLIHFTSKENIPSILKFGILSRVAIFSNGNIDEFRICDLERFEGNLNAISVSITRPNEYMLKQKVDEGLLIEPYIIEIDAKMLLDKNMRFIYCSGNAAKNEINRGPLLKNFLQMFPSTYVFRDGTTRSRTYLNRKSNEPTDGQAEILVERSIPAKYILGKPIPWEQWKKINSESGRNFYGKKDDFYFF